MAQVKIGKLDFFPMSQKIEEVSIFFPTMMDGWIKKIVDSFKSIGFQLLMWNVQSNFCNVNWNHIELKYWYLISYNWVSGKTRPIGQRCVLSGGHWVVAVVMVAVMMEVAVTLVVVVTSVRIIPHRSFEFLVFRKGVPDLPTDGWTYGQTLL